jgi:hypothetical protein
MVSQYIVAGGLLAAGTILFGIGASAPSLFKAWTGSLDDYLRTLIDHPRAWQIAMHGMLAGVLATVAGAGVVTSILWTAGDRLFSALALIGFLLGAPLWAAFQAYRLSVPVWAAREAAKAGTPPPLFEPLQAWAGALFSIYMVLGYLAVAAYGGALLVTGLLPTWLGWTSLVFGTAGALSMMVGRWPRIAGMPLFEPPFMIGLMPLLIGILLLLHG